MDQDKSQHSGGAAPVVAPKGPMFHQLWTFLSATAAQKNQAQDLGSAIRTSTATTTMGIRMTATQIITSTSATSAYLKVVLVPQRLVLC